jgi:hypothetical protein
MYIMGNDTQIFQKSFHYAYFFVNNYLVYDRTKGTRLLFFLKQIIY